MFRWLIFGTLACQAPSAAPARPGPEPPRPDRAHIPSFAPAGDEAAPAAAPVNASKPGKALEVGGKPVHPGCISELVEQLNGDLVVHSVYLSIPDGRGCERSNRYSEHSRPAYWRDGKLWYDQSEAGDRFGYQLHRSLDEHRHVLATQLVTSGTFGASSYLFVRVGEAADVVGDPSGTDKRVTITLTRLGEVEEREAVEPIIRALAAP